jgi:phosphoglycolate phosphatase
MAHPGGPLSGTWVLFDWNGTMVADADRAEQAVTQVLTAHRLPTLYPGQLKEVFRLPLADMFQRLGVPVGRLAAAEADWNTAMAALPPTPRPGAAAELASLRGAGARLGVVSAASAAAVHADMTALGLTTQWDFTAFGVTRKDTALRRHTTEQGPTVYVGDTEYDIHSARAAGCVAIGIPSGYCSASRLTDAGADHLITDFSQLTTLLTTPEKEALS